MTLTPALLDRLRSAASAHTEAVATLAKRICEVPAPTGEERQRAELVSSLLSERGYAPEMDTVGNVYARRGNRRDRPVLMLLAHTDTVFPKGTAISVVRDGSVLRGPGIGDNSASVAAMIGTLDLLDELGEDTGADVVAVADVGEEGLGNLRGAWAAVERYRDQLGAVIALDGQLGRIINEAVGSVRWRVTISGPGGHSYRDFGAPSAVHGLGRVVAAIADLQVPENPKVTYNVGLIGGGTSVNTIAPSAEAVVDMRSTDAEELGRLAGQVRDIIEQCPRPGLSAEIEVLGERPAGVLDRSAPLIGLAADAITWLGLEPEYEPASTDANVPLSLGIPAVCVGVTRGDRVHTTEEFIEVPPLGDGLAQVARLCLEASALVAGEQARPE